MNLKLLTPTEEAIALERKRIREGVERIMGKEGSHSGSLGYQGLVSGITSFQTLNDQQRDRILTLIDSNV